MDREFIEGTVNTEDYVKGRNFLDAAIISLNAVVNWGKRYAKLAKDMAEKEKDTDMSSCSRCALTLQSFGMTMIV